MEFFPEKNWTQGVFDPRFRIRPPLYGIVSTRKIGNKVFLFKVVDPEDLWVGFGNFQLHQVFIYLCIILIKNHAFLLQSIIYILFLNKLSKVSRKKIFFLVARPLREGDKGRATRKKELLLNFF